jgi:hypothetical protein
MSDRIEEGLRRPDWRPGAPLTLLNGEVFHFRPPTIRIWRGPDESGAWRQFVGTDFGEEFDDAINECESLTQQRQDIFEYIFYFADAMLTRNYREEIRNHYKHILYFTSEEHVKKVWWAIFDLARGIDPKERISGGSPTPS